MAIMRVDASIIGSLYRNSDAISTSTGILQNSSIMNLPTREACQDVPHDVKTILFIPDMSSLDSPISLRKTSPVSSDILPRNVSVMAVGCSNISFSMKCRYPPFSAIVGDHVISFGVLDKDFPSASSSLNPFPSIITRSPSSRKIILLV